jgi:hypothetical protein
MDRTKDLPDVLLVVVVLGYDAYAISNQVDGIEAHTELANETQVCAFGEAIKELLGAGSSEGSEVVN